MILYTICGIYAFFWFRWMFIVLKNGGVKYDIIKMVENYIYYSKLDYQQLLTLDNPAEDSLVTRLQGLKYLRRRLHSDKNVQTTNLTDCRFKKTKVLMPLLQEFELPTPNFITAICDENVVLKDGLQQMHLGSDAVHFFNQDFYNRLRDEWHEIMTTNTTQYSFTTLTQALVEHSSKITSLTHTDEVRYCLSGSEAVDVAMKDVKTSTGKKLIVRFKNAYHGHSSGVSNDAKNQIYLNEMDDAALKFIRKYHYKIAGVIINPMQFFVGPNCLSPPGEKLTMGKRHHERVAKDKYSNWLYTLNQECNYCTNYLTPIAFIVDDVYFAFRTSQLFSFAYFSTEKQPVRPDVIILGKGVAGGFPLSIVCGKKRFMNYYDRHYILKVNKNVGTFSAWEGGIIASNLFLDKVVNMTLEFDRIQTKFDDFVKKTNAAYEVNNLPIRIHNFSNTFTIDYMVDSLYNSMYVQFLMSEDIYFSSQSTGKFNLTDDWTEKKLKKLSAKLVAAGIKMRSFGFLQTNTNRCWYFPVAWMFICNCSKLQYQQVLQDKQIDIEVSHNHPFNKFGHFWSSIVMIFACYPLVYYGNYQLAALWFLLSHTLRQAGHFFYERQDRDAELRKFGHKDGTKKTAGLFIGLSIIIFVYRDYFPIFNTMSDDELAIYFTLLTVIPHFSEIWHKYGLVRGFHWAVKIITDPFTDIYDFYGYATIHPRWVLDIA